MENKLLEFDDVLIEPQFSFVRSRKDVDLASKFLGHTLSLPVINSNMDTVSSPELCKALGNYGCISSLHRFWSIEENVKAYTESRPYDKPGLMPIVSIGIGDKEFERAKALHQVGATTFMLDVAHAANIAVVEMFCSLKQEFPDSHFIVGDFGTAAEIREFIRQANMRMNDIHCSFVPDVVKVGIGIGSVCHTRLVTGVGNTAISCIMDCAEAAEERDMKLILDGGVQHIGDIAKALVAGADMVMSGALFAGTDEAAGNIVNNSTGKYKEYRGSASQKSYEVQNKVASWRAAEGTSILVPYKGPVIKILDSINGGLRSSCSYVNAVNLGQLKLNGRFSIKNDLQKLLA